MQIRDNVVAIIKYSSLQQQNTILFKKYINKIKKIIEFQIINYNFFSYFKYNLSTNHEFL